MANKIMVVDDDVDMVGATKMVLEMEGYQVVTDYGGEEALQKAEAEKPHLKL